MADRINARYYWAIIRADAWCLWQMLTMQGIYQRYVATTRRGDGSLEWFQVAAVNSKWLPVRIFDESLPLPKQGSGS